MSSHAWLVLLLFMTLVLAVSLLGLAASGHFPAEHRAPALRRGWGRSILLGSIACGAASFVLALALAWTAVPWYAAVIGGGAVVLFAPLVLQFLPDRFIDGLGALLTFGGMALLLSLMMFVCVGGAPS